MKFIIYSTFGVCLLYSLFFGVAEVHTATISPLRYSVSLDPGASEVLAVTIINDSDEEKQYQPVVESFAIDPKTGRAIFSTRSSATQFVDSIAPSSFSLPPGEEREVLYTLTVPDEQSAGVSYLALLVKEQQKGESLGSDLGIKQGTLVFLYTAGTIQEELVKIAFAPQSTLSLNTQQQLNMTIENTGSIHVIPRGYIEISDIFGKSIEKISVNPSQKKIAPHVLWKESFLVQMNNNTIGPVNAKLFVTYGLSERELQARTSWWQISIYIGLGIVATLILLSGGYIFYKRKRV